MIVKLEKEFGMYNEEGSTMHFFGVPFTCTTKKITGGKDAGKVESEWFAELPDVQGQAMIDAYRCVEVKEQPKPAKKDK